MLSLDMKLAATLLFSFALLLIVAQPASATAFITIEPDGETTYQVLSITDAIEKSITESIASEIENTQDGSPLISLFTKEDKITLNVISQNSPRSFDVTKLDGDILEIKERPEVTQLSISSDGDQFILEQGEVLAKTAHKIILDPESAKIILETPQGNRLLALLPKEVVELVLRSKIITQIDKDGKINLTESETGQLLYIVDGEKSVNLFNLVDYSVPVTATISASTGEVLQIDQPKWLQILGFMFG